MTVPPTGGDPPDRRTPPIVFSAMAFALLGFACAVPAIVGLILGLVARPRAKAAGAGIGLATSAIAISIAWLVLFAILVIMAIVGTSP